MRQSSYTCSACRSRKVRCDGRRDVCTSCERLGLSCSFRGQPPAAHPDRRRTKTACVPCRERKSRCDGFHPSCRRCQTRGLVCTYESSKASSNIPPIRSPLLARSSPSADIVTPSSPAALPHSSDILEIESDQGHLYPTDSLVLQALDGFFRKLHYVPVFAFLHQATVVESYRSGNLDKALLLALTGVASSLIDLGCEARDTGARFVDLSESIIIENREKPTLAHIQALILIIKCREYQGRFSSLFILTAIASRFATALRLSYENHDLPPVLREVRRRTWWSLFMIDSQISSGYDDFSLCDVARLRLQLPCLEKDFNLGLPRRVEAIHGTFSTTAESELDPLAQVIRSKWLRHKALRFSKRVLAEPQTDPFEGMVSLQEEINAFCDALPPSLQMSESNARLHAYWTSFAAFATVHITCLTARMILCRLVLGGLKEALPEEHLNHLDSRGVMQGQSSCRDSVNCMADAFKILLDCKAKNSIVDLDLAICAYQCARLLFHLSRTSPTPIPPDELVARVSYCAKFLDEMFFECERIRSIRDDMERLIEYGFSTAPTTDRPSTQSQVAAATPTNQVDTSHVFSQHSLVGQMEISKDAQSPSMLLNRQPETQAARQPKPSDRIITDFQQSGFGQAQLNDCFLDIDHGMQDLSSFMFAIDPNL